MMEVILFDSVKNVGRAGDKVKVAGGFFRNFLHPKGLAEEANAGNLKRFEKLKKKAFELAAAKVDDAKAIAASLEGVVVTLKAKAGDSDKLFGSITQGDIADALTAQGFTVQKKQIRTEGPIKSLGEYNVAVEIHPEVDGHVKLVIERS